MATKKDDDTFVVDVRGISITVDKDWRDNFELVESIADMDMGNVLAVPRTLYWLAGKKANDVKESLRNEKGVISITAAREWCLDFINACNAKN